MTKKEALELLVKCPQDELFKEAARIRDENLGKKLWFSSVASGTLPCLVEPKCAYCSYYREERYSKKILLKAVLKAKSLGFKHFHISGGTSLSKGFDESVLELLKTIKKHTDIKLEFNFGPSFNRDSVVEFKKMGLGSLTSSLECINPKLFSALKPGDSLNRRKEILAWCDDLSLPTRSVMLAGLGESDEDLIEHLFYLKKCKSLYQLTISKFRPFKNTLYANHKECSALKVARISAVARMLMPKIELSIPWGNVGDLPLWFAFGGGGQVMGMKVAKKRPADEPLVQIHSIKHEDEVIYLIDKRALVMDFAKSLGFCVGYDLPEALRGV